MLSHASLYGMLECQLCCEHMLLHAEHDTYMVVLHVEGC